MIEFTNCLLLPFTRSRFLPRHSTRRISQARARIMAALPVYPSLVGYLVVKIHRGISLHPTKGLPRQKNRVFFITFIESFYFNPPSADERSPHYTAGFPSVILKRVIAEFAESSFFLLLMRRYFDEIPQSFNGHPRGILGIAERLVLTKCLRPLARIMAWQREYPLLVSGHVEPIFEEGNNKIYSLFTFTYSIEGFALGYPSTCIRTFQTAK